MSSNSRQLYRCAGAAQVRATGHTLLPVPPWPDLTSDADPSLQDVRRWVRDVWSLEPVAEAIEQASPIFARQIAVVCSTAEVDSKRVLRTAVSLIRYLLRMSGRATPFGLFAGIAPVQFGASSQVEWRHRHRPVARATGAWLSDVITEFEARSEVLRRLDVVANTTAFVRGDRLVVPYPSGARRDRQTAPSEVSLRYTPAVRIAMEHASAPCGFGHVVEKITAEFPSAPAARIEGMVTGLLRQRALISSLHAPSTTVDALGHLLSQLDAAGVGDLPETAEVCRQLRLIRVEIDDQNNSSAGPTRTRRARLRERMAALSPGTVQPVAVDLRLDCTVSLPTGVAREAERAASVLTRLSALSFGTAGWQSYHNRFFERYGIGSLVPLRDVIDPDVGIGLPAGYLGATAEPPGPVYDREHRLLALAQEAALDGREEIELGDEFLDALTVGDHERVEVPPHLELRFHVGAASRAALDAGDFLLTVISPSRGIGTSTGRFLALLDDVDRKHFAAVFNRPDNEGALPAQLSFSPLNPDDAHLGRAPRMVPEVISLAEHRPAQDHAITLDDLVVGCDRRRLYLASLSRGRLISPMTLHALNLRGHTPPVARFLAEISRAQAAVVSTFPWGPAAQLPFTPRIRYGRTVLAPARWQLRRTDLPGKGAAWTLWRCAFDRWRSRRRVPSVVCLTEGDQELRLDLNEDAHLAVLRSHLNASECAVLTEARGGDGWIDGHAHEVVVALTAAQSARWPVPPPISPRRVLGRDHGHLPGGTRWMLATIYGSPERHREIIGHHLATLWRRFDRVPCWWYLRYDNPRPHLRLRIELSEDEDFAKAAAHVSGWFADLRRLGLAGDLQFATSYPETGRWGTGPLMKAAEEIFAEDSRSLAVQFAEMDQANWQALTAANLHAIAASFTGSPADGRQWLTDHARLPADRPLDRAVLAEAIRLCDPADDWAALRRTPGGEALHRCWTARGEAITRYRELLDGMESGEADPDLVLDSLLHAHHIRAAGIDKDDERQCVRLARAAAMALEARNR